jgi:hypothetical protein
MKTRHFLLVGAALLIGAAFRLRDLSGQSLWFDEGWSAHAAVQPTFIDAWNADATNPPLYYALLHMAARFVGISEFGLRFFSFGFGMLALPLTYALVRRVSDARSALIALWLAALSAPLWWASQEARMYTLMTCCVLAAALAWHRLTRPLTTRTQRRWGLVLCLAELALLYTHNTAPVIVVWLNAVTLIVWLQRRQPPLRAWIAAQVIVVVLWLPYFVARFLLLTEANSAIASAPALTLGFIAQVWASLWLAPWERVARSALGTGELAWLALSALSAAAALLQRPARWLALHALLLLSGVIIGLMILSNEYHGRYAVMLVPLALAWLAVGLRRIDARLVTVLIVAQGALLVANIALRPPNDDARSIAAHYAQRLDTGDSALMWSYADRYELAYYWRALGVKAKRVTLPEGADLDAVLPLLPTNGDVALNVWYTQRADFRGMMDCLLSAGTVAVPEVTTVSGMTSLYYDAPSLTPPLLRPVAWTFSAGGTLVARVIEVGQIARTRANQALCLPLSLALLQAVSAEISAAVVVRDAAGRLIASADAIFADAVQRTTAMQPEGAIRAFALLRLPDGTPPGDYGVYLRLYDPTDLSGYIPLEDALYGRDVEVGVWTVEPGARWLDAVPDSLDLRAVVEPSADCRAASGTVFPLTLLWAGGAALPDVRLRLPDGRETIIPTNVIERDDLVRDQRAVPIPPEALAGEAVVVLPDGTIIARCQIDALPFLVEAPAVDAAVSATFPGVGALIGYRDFAIPEITLVWRAESASAISYTVFVQLVSADGRVIAQSDALPMAGTRPTTGWRAAEYIADRHVLRVNVPDYRGEARLIAGLYDAASGTRVPLADGADHVLLWRGMAET